MPEKLVLHQWVLCHYLVGYRCKQCGATGHPVALLYPMVTRVGTTVTLTYPVRCSCGGAGHIEMKMPLVLFGLTLVQAALIEAHKKYGSRGIAARRRAQTVEPRETSLRAPGREKQSRLNRVPIRVPIQKTAFVTYCR